MTHQASPDEYPEIINRNTIFHWIKPKHTIARTAKISRLQNCDGNVPMLKSTIRMNSNANLQKIIRIIDNLRIQNKRNCLRLGFNGGACEEDHRQQRPQLFA